MTHEADQQTPVNPDQETTDQDPTLESLEEPTQQTSPQQDPAIDETARLQAYIQDLERRIVDQTAAYSKVADELEQLRNRPEPEQPRDIDADRTRFFEDPIGHLTTLEERVSQRVARQLQEALAPLREVADTFRFGNTYEQYLERYKQDPRFSQALSDPIVVSAVEQIMKQPGTEINDNTFRAAIVSAVGLKNMGLLTNVDKPVATTPTPSPTGATPVNTAVPHVRPTAPAGPGRQDTTVKRRPLSENERLAMKIAGIKTEEEWWRYVEMRPHEVITAPIPGKEKK